jgi:hypothetical protein
MFYEEHHINNTLKCKQCYNRLDRPNILPCGSVICTFCVLATKIVNNEYDCYLCKQKHVYPSNGFPLCEQLVELLLVKPSEMHKSESVKQLFELQKRIESFRKSSNNGIKQIKDYCNDLRTQIRESTELSINKLYTLNHKLISRVDQFEVDLIKSLDKNREENRDDYNRIINDIDKLTKQYDSNEVSVFKLIEIYQKLEEEKSKLGKIIFNKNSLKFQANKSDLNENIIGTFVYMDKK